MNMDIDIERTSRNVNSKRLHNVINRFLTDRIERLVYVSHASYFIRDNVDRVCREFFDELVVRGSIEHYVVKVDDSKSMTFPRDGGLLSIVVKFRQTNCINTTEYDYKGYRIDG